MTAISGAIKDNTIAASEEPSLNIRVRASLEQVARRRVPITYQALAKALQLSPPNTIHQLTVTLEHLMSERRAEGSDSMPAQITGALTQTHLAVQISDGELL